FKRLARRSSAIDRRSTDRSSRSRSSCGDGRRWPSSSHGGGSRLGGRLRHRLSGSGILLLQQRLLLMNGSCHGRRHRGRRSRKTVLFRHGAKKNLLSLFLGRWRKRTDKITRNY